MEASGLLFQTSAVTAPIGPNATDYFFCSGTPYIAQEKVFSFSNPDISNVHVELTNLSPPTINLAVFVLAQNACNEFQCIAGGGPSTDLNFLPKGVPEPIVQKLYEASNETLSTPAVQEKLLKIGTTTMPPEQRTPKAAQAFVESEIKNWEAVIKASGVEQQ